jgi:serine O-acetyltransferase
MINILTYFTNKSLLIKDFNAFCAFRGKDKSLKILLLAILSPEFQLIILYRFYSFLYQKNIWFLKIISMIIYILTKMIYSTDIHPKAHIGGKFVLGHHYGITIGPDVVVGSNIIIFNGVTIGNKNVGPVSNEMPRIGNNVIIGTGAKILGKIHIGENVKIGANSVLLKNAPNNSVAVGIPAKILTSKEKYS